jgi:acetyltransferase-like isoleucine patch superfamily enzyme
MKYSLDFLALRVKRGDTPLFRTARRFFVFFLTANIPVPAVLKPAGRLFYELRFYVPGLWKRAKSLLYTTPVFCCRCESVGKHLQLCALPSVRGHALLYIGDDVHFSGSFAITSGRFNDHPILRIGNRAFIGHNVSITCNREVVIEDDAMIAGNCKISDYDGHPASLEKRLAHSLPAADEIVPVRICKGAWIGSDVFILKGVTIGEGAVVGASSVVTHDIPPHCVAAGSPAKVVKFLRPASSVTFATAFSAAA